MTDLMLEKAARLLRPVQDFPKKGILFFDIQPVLRDYRVVHHLIENISALWADDEVDVIAGFDARGFIIGQALALMMGLPFEQIRKKGKLPGKVMDESYKLEYGEATVEMIDDGFIKGKRVLLVDDLLATGGTALAGANLVERLGGTVVGFCAVTEIPHLGGRGKLEKYRVESLISIIDNQPVVGVEYCVDMFTRDFNTGELILVNRIGDELTKGLAMPGGRIERESPQVAAFRELEEETGCKARTIKFLGILSGLGRDPRGPKVSVVMGVSTDASQTRNEPGLTEVVKVSPNQPLPAVEKFAFDHGSFVYKVTKTIAEEEAKEVMVS